MRSAFVGIFVWIRKFFKFKLSVDLFIYISFILTFSNSFSFADVIKSKNKNTDDK